MLAGDFKFKDLAVIDIVEGMDDKIYELVELWRVIDIDFAISQYFFKSSFENIVQFIADTFYADILLNTLQLDAIQMVLELIKDSLDLDGC